MGDLLAEDASVERTQKGGFGIKKFILIGIVAMALLGVRIGVSGCGGKKDDGKTEEKSTTRRLELGIARVAEKKASDKEHVVDDDRYGQQSQSDQCGEDAGQQCCTHPKWWTGSDGCSTEFYLDCVNGICTSCGDEGEKCCDNGGSPPQMGADGCQTLNNLDCSNGICAKCGSSGQICCADEHHSTDPPVGSDGCDTSSNLDCVHHKCTPCGQIGEKCCDDKQAWGVGGDGCVDNAQCLDDYKCHKA